MVDREVLSYQNGIVTPIDLEFIEVWQDGDYGKVDLQTAIKNEYQSFMDSKKEQSITKFKNGMKVVQYGLYSFEDQVWQWVEKDVASCVWNPGTTWQWVLWENS